MDELSQINEEIAAVINGFVTSRWLRDALLDAVNNRDPLDAAKDALQLAALLDRRAGALLSQGRL